MPQASRIFALIALCLLFSACGSTQNKTLADQDIFSVPADDGYQLKRMEEIVHSRTEGRNQY